MILGKRTDQLLEMLFHAGISETLDPANTLGLIERLARLHRGQQSELRRTVELLHRITRPSRPKVTVQAAGQQVNIASAQEVAAPVTWGGDEAGR